MIAWIITAILTILCIFLFIKLSKANTKSLVEQANVEAMKVQLQTNMDAMRTQLQTNIDSMNAQLQTKNDQLRTKDEQLASKDKQLADKDKQLEDKEKQLAAKDKQIEENKEMNATLMRQQEERFKNLANEIMDNSTKRFNETSSQRLTDLLTPLKENIENFRKAVGDAYNNESRERFSLKNELEKLVALNESIGRDARDLNRALRSDSKVQGDWGEMILEKLLEKSGLQKGTHFDTQVTHDVDGTKLIGENDRNLRADVVVYYPDDRCVVIDSKVSLTSFIDYINLADDPDDENGEKRKKAATDHLTSVRNHIKELATKNYQDLIGKKRMDFVMMFIPNEAAYIAAMQIEPGLWQEAYDKRVLIVSPTQLISVLRMLSQLWKQDTINRNVEEIARLAGTMLDKFSGMMDSFDDMQNALSKAQTACSTVRARLSEGKGNIFVTANKIKELGAKTTKPLPEK
jgi:DNA recombination protein RmuC